VLALLLIMVGGIWLFILLIVHAQDKRWIRADLQRRGAHHIQVHDRWLEGRHTQRFYDVTYVTATGQPGSTACLIYSPWLRKKSLHWLMGPAALYALIPDRKVRSAEGSPPQSTNKRSHYTPLTAPKKHKR
jgi:hypothetical protein